MKTLKLLSTPAVSAFIDIESRTEEKDYTEHSKLITLPKNCGLFRSYALSAFQHLC
jgi:hypothetical protein